MAPRLSAPAAALMQIPWMAAKLSASVDFGFKTFQEGATECVVREGAVDIGAHHAAIRRDHAVRRRPGRSARNRNHLCRFGVHVTGCSLT